MDPFEHVDLFPSTALFSCYSAVHGLTLKGASRSRKTFVVRTEEEEEEKTIKLMSIYYSTIN
jgi:hypothetical protein